MSYCRWSEGDLYAYRGSSEYVVHVAGRCVGKDIREIYLEPSAAALLARILWLGSKGCDYPWDALRYLKEDVVAEVEENEASLHELA